ncbi:type VI secretion system baseplate subunit TssG [Teredinibacter turnerae]|uniref:type VI secretion system baseplate subunit TssG n=1 Tax=Teredinibacter turnerae TaxID=2426 RepID=UPI0003A1ABB8|nr:type VI secretion system baseplate subunit TssG [Teredinibacter turnerae]
MPTKSRSKSLSVIRRLVTNTGEFAFAQAVRLLERSAAYSKPDQKANTQQAGKYSPAYQEVVRFKGNPSLGFPESEIESIEQLSNEQQARYFKVTTNFMGLTGSMGVLPYHYSELAIQRSKKRDQHLQRFLDLFNHRILSIFYQASIKYRLPLNYELSQLSRTQQQTLEKHDDRISQSVLSLIGLGGKHLTDRHSIYDETLIFYAGLLAQQVKTARGLQQILSDYFSIPVSIKEFVGQWQPLIDDVRTRLPSPGMPEGQNACLGKSCMLGNQGWFAQGKIQIHLGPLTSEQHRSFAPGSRTFTALNELCRFYLGMERDFEFVLKVKRSHISDKIQLGHQNAPIMGWSTWLASTEQGTDQQTSIMDIRISSSC